MSGARRVAVVGGGVAGLATAWFLRRDGHRPTVLEASVRLGGKVRTDQVAGRPLDVGADAFLARRPEVVELCAALGLADDLVSPATGRVVLWVDGDLRPLPRGTVLGVPGDLDALEASEVLTPDGLAAARAEAELPPPTLGPGEDAPLRDVVVARWGAEVADRLVDPLVAGIYAGDVARLGVRSATPALAALLDEARERGTSATAVAAARRAADPPDDRPVFHTLRGGLGRLVERLAEGGGEVRTAAAVHHLERAGRHWLVDGEPFDDVVVATPAPAAARLLADLAPGAAAALGAVRTASSVVVALALPAGATLPEGSGLLVPSGEGRVVKAATWSSQKWPHLGGDDAVLLRCSAGRVDDPGPVGLDDDALVEVVRDELGQAVGLDVPPIEARVARWRDALPQYEVGHLAAMAAAQQAAADVGIALAGSAYDGVGLPAVVRSARLAADRVGSSG